MSQSGPAVMLAFKRSVGVKESTLRVLTRTGKPGKPGKMGRHFQSGKSQGILNRVEMSGNLAVCKSGNHVPYF